MSGAMRASRRRLRMRRNWLAPAALTAIALGVPAAGGVAQAAPMHGQQLTTVGPVRKTMQHHQSARRLSFNQNVASYVKRLEGAPYAWGEPRRPVSTAPA
jgi:hypothetical protein